jgi:hypothetical protein
LEDAEMQLTRVTQENDQKNRYLLQQLRGVADAVPRYLAPARFLVERFTSQGGTDYGDLLERRLQALEDCQISGASRSTTGSEVDPVEVKNLQSQVSQLLATVGEQKLELSQLKGRVGQVQVEIQGVVFQSVLDVEILFLKTTRNTVRIYSLTQSLFSRLFMAIWGRAVRRS